LSFHFGVIFFEIIFQINGNANANEKESGGGSNIMKRIRGMMMLHPITITFPILQDQGLYEGFYSIDKKDECGEV